ncbi:MAG: hypothetical protein AB1513_09900 [Pseudomonadota bacterium]
MEKIKLALELTPNQLVILQRGLDEVAGFIEDELPICPAELEPDLADVRYLQRALASQAAMQPLPLEMQP